MALEVKKQPRETSQALIHRFTKSVKESGILVRARKIMFREKKKSENLKREAALRREEIKKEYERLRKLGKIE